MKTASLLPSCPKYCKTSKAVCLKCFSILFLSNMPFRSLDSSSRKLKSRCESCPAWRKNTETSDYSQQRVIPQIQHAKNIKQLEWKWTAPETFNIAHTDAVLKAHSRESLLLKLIKKVQLHGSTHRSRPSSTHSSSYLLRHATSTSAYCIRIYSSPFALSIWENNP